MSKNNCVIVYGSERGLTQKVAEFMATRLRESSLEVEVFNVKNFEASALLNYDNIILGSSTWGNGDLQKDFYNFEPSLRKLNLQGHFATSFALGNSRYPHYCEAGEILQSHLRNCKAKLIQKPLYIDSLISVDYSPIEDWVQWLIERIKNN